jgi:hypothetical protein
MMIDNAIKPVMHLLEVNNKLANLIISMRTDK